MHSRGLRELREPLLLHRVARTLPSQAEAIGSVWESGTDWIAVFASSEDGGIRVYCASCRPLPSGWRPLGEGWAAFEAASAAPRVKVPAPRKLAASDPRELRY